MFFTLYISLLLRSLRTFLKLRHLRSYFSGARIHDIMYAFEPP